MQQNQRKHFSIKKVKWLSYYFHASYRRKSLDASLEKYQFYYQGIVLDIGGRNRGRFAKPKNKVEKWIFADINVNYNPDIALDVCDMATINDSSIDVVNAIELFEHVAYPEKGLAECYRVLKSGGLLIVSTPFIYPIHDDPFDFQRWAIEKWKKTLESNGFTIRVLDITGRYFTVLSDMIRGFITSLPRAWRYCGYCFFPLLDLCAWLDSLSFAKNNPYLSSYHGGYFIIASKDSRV